MNTVQMTEAQVREALDTFVKILSDDRDGMYSNTGDALDDLHTTMKRNDIAYNESEDEEEGQ